MYAYLERKEGTWHREPGQNTSASNQNSCALPLCQQLGGRPEDQRARAIIRYLINLYSTDLIESSKRRIEESGVDSPEDVAATKEKLVGFSSELKEQKKQLEDFLFDTLYRDYRVIRETSKAKRFVKAIFEAYISDVRQLPPEYQEWSEDVGLHEAVCDYIAGMTDRYAQDQYLFLFQPYQKL